MKKIKSGVVAAAWLTALLSPLLQALPEDRDKPIRINSDSADIDDARGISIYRGNVVMDQGTIHIDGEQVTIYSNNEGIYKVVIQGSPGHYHEKPAHDEEIVKASALTINYDFRNEHIELLRKAKLVQEGNTFTGDQIEYFISTQTVKARSSTAGPQSERVEMVIQPNKK
jgi:lipopolysaccharide export system protein LptA